MKTISLQNQKILSCIIAPVLLYIMGVTLMKEAPSFYGFNPHPYLVTSIIFSAYFGLRFSLLFSFILSTQYLLLLHSTTDYEAVETLLTVEYLSLPIALIILSSIIGEFRTNSNHDRQRLKSASLENQNLSENLINKVNFLDKESFELKKQLVNKLDTTTNIFNMVQGLNVLNQEELFTNFFNVLQAQIELKEGAIYEFNELNHSLNLIYTKSESNINNGLEQSINCSYIEDDIIRRTLATKELSTIKDVFSEKNELDHSTAVAAAPLFIKEKFFGIVIITKLPFLQYTPNNFQLLSLYSKWLSQSLAHAVEFEELTSNSIYNQNLGIYTYKFLSERVSEEIDSDIQTNTSFTLVSLTLTESEHIDPIKLKHFKKLISKILTGSTRKMDVVSEGVTLDQFLILISSTNTELVENTIRNINEKINFFIKNKKTKDLFNTQIKKVAHTKQQNIDELLNDLGSVDA